MEPLTPGTNAVFRIGSRVIKLYAPRETGMDQSPDRLTELRASRLALERGVRAPSVLAEGICRDRYEFAYLVTEYIGGPDLGTALQKADILTAKKRGRELRAHRQAQPPRRPLQFH